MSLLPYDACPTSLATINNLCFTRREVDIMACLLNARGTSKTASLLSIAPKTVVNHIRNIMIKLDCNSREGIIDFIERSHKLPLFRKHYSNLAITAAFEKSLKDISRFNRNKTLSFRTLYEENNEYHKQLTYYLGSHFRIVGITTIVEPYTTLTPLSDLLSTLQKEEKIMYLLEQQQIETFLSNNLSTEALSPISSQAISLNRILFILPERENLSPLPEHFTCLEYVDLSQRKNYYFFFFEVLEKLFSNSSIEKIFQEFKNFYEAAEKNPGTQFSFPELRTKDKEQTKHFSLPALKQILQQRSMRFLIAAFMSIIAFGISLVFFRSPNSLNFLENSSQFPLRENEYPIRSDLNIPNSNAFLPRPELIEKISKAFKSSQEIEYLALVGVGGAGKTTLARQYARQQKNNVVWELNAETKDSFINSFKDLAYALAKTKEQKEELNFIQKTQNLEEKGKQILLFIKKGLRKNENWLLIYDNVVTFSDIKDHLPQDPQLWGIGKVIITTRDSNIKNTSYLQPENVISIEELSLDEALTLLVRILYNYIPEKLTPEQKKKAVDFLQHIPLFPLDISVAAYYIENSKITFEEYLERINQYKEIFENVQKTLLSETSNYTKTRYGIITSSLEKIIGLNHHFKELLLFICLLDSQNILKELIEHYIKGPITDSFLHELRKYSLITSGVISSTFSLHRSTQVLSQNFLLNLYEKDSNREKVIDKIVNTLKYFYNLNIEKNHKNIILLIAHMEALNKNLKRMNLQKELEKKHESDLCLLLGYAHKNCSQNFVLAKKYLAKVYALQKNTQSLSNQTLAILLKDLGEICVISNDFNESLFYCQESLNLCKKISHSEMLVAKNLVNMAWTYQRENNFKEAQHCLKTALVRISTLGDQLKMDIEAEIYESLSYIYSTNYINKPESYQAVEYGLKSLQTLNASNLFFTDPSQKVKNISCKVVKQRAILGRAYGCLGNYQAALLQYKEAEYLTAHSPSHCSHNVVMPRILSGFGEVFLRTDKLEMAENKLTESIHISRILLGERDTLRARIYRAEARVRLGKLREAYEDCTFVLKTGQVLKHPYYTLIHLICFYHAAIIKHKQGELEKSLEHFSDFLKGMKAFCQSFLDKKEYQDLEAKGIFVDIVFNEGQVKAQIKQCLQYSATIFTAIYGSSHPFIRDYVLKNCE